MHRANSCGRQGLGASWILKRPYKASVELDVSAYDMISRSSMLEALRQLPGGGAALPFVRMFYGRISEYLWEDDFGVVHRIAQGEGGEQGDALMPLLFSLGQHEALQQVHRVLNPGERLFAFLDDVYLLTKPDRVGPVVRRPARSVEVARRNPHSRRQDANLEPRRPSTCRVRRVGKGQPEL